MNYFSSNFKLGILGGGQLGKMLLAETRKFDIQTYVLDPSKEAPSQFGANHFFIGDLMDFDTVYDFGKKVNHFNKLSINNFDIQELQFKKSINYTSFSIPRIEHLRILQGYHDSDLEFILYQYKYRCKPANKWIKNSLLGKID
jgi:5-(carboxyamino)imidazole ribonucleotide synthase